MEFAPSAVAGDYTKRMRAFLKESILPAEAEYDAFREARRGTPPSTSSHPSSRP